MEGTVSEFLANLTLFDLALIAGATVAVIGLILALLSPGGRDKLAALGLRVADALVALLERLLSDPALLDRLDTRIDRDVEKTMALDTEFAAAMAESAADAPGRGVITVSGMTESDLDAAYASFRALRDEAERDAFRDVLWEALEDAAATEQEHA
jgi:hypothetical protein